MGKKITALLLGVFLAAGALLVYHAVKQHEHTPSSQNRVRKQSFDTWNEFVSRDGHFKIMLPSHPLCTRQKLPLADTGLTYTYDLYTSEDQEGATFLIHLIRYPEGVDLSQPEILLENVMNEMLSSNSHHQLHSMKFSSFRSHVALDFTLSSPEVFLANKAFIIDRTLFVLSCMDKTSHYDERAFKFFTDSFTLTASHLSLSFTQF